MILRRCRSWALSSSSSYGSPTCLPHRSNGRGVKGMSSCRARIAALSSSEMLRSALALSVSPYCGASFLAVAPAFMSSVTPILKSFKVGKIRVFSEPLMRCSTSTVSSSPRRESGHSHRVPEVELVVALVVVGDAGVGVYCLGAFVELVRWDLGRHQARLVAEDASVEDRADLAYNPPSFERLYPADDLAARDPHLAPDRRERLPLQRKLLLDEVENVLV